MFVNLLAILRLYFIPSFHKVIDSYKLLENNINATAM